MAILDSGVDGSHEFLLGKVTAEACHSTTDRSGATTSQSLCPGGSASASFQGAGMRFVQDSHSRSRRAVLRGLHYQDMTAPLGKLVRCTVGEIFDVAVDLRVGSPTFGHFVSVNLSAENKRQMYVPVGFAHGFQALTDAVEVQYRQTGYYVPAAEGSVAWNDPDIGIRWPIDTPVLSARDQNATTLKEYAKKPAFRYGQI